MRTATLVTERLSVSYRTEEGELPAVRGASLSIQPGEAVGLVGESGSGKTTLALGAIGYLPGSARIVSGASTLHGVDLLSLPRRELRRLWGSKIGLVSQDPQTALNPTLTIGRQLDEMGTRHLGLRRAAARESSLAMLARVDIAQPRTAVDRYPHQLSGGMLQRCAIALTLLTRPDMLILDEPTTALDVTTQALILDLLEDLRDEYDLAILYITHNLGVISRISDRVAVMYAGEILEQSGVVDLFARPLHPYTANLLHCVPRLGHSPAAGRLATLPGDLPALDDPPPGCLFAPRCPLALAGCTGTRPPLIEVTPGRWTACLRWEVLTEDDGQRAAIRAQREEDSEGAGARGSGRRLAPAQAPLLTVSALTKDFRGAHRRTKVKAVAGVDLAVDTRQTFGLVGESGSGKTTLARAVAGLTPPTSGTVSLEGMELPPTVSHRERDIVRKLQMVFQSPTSSLNPRRTVRRQLVRPLMHLLGFERQAAHEKAGKLLEAVRLPPSYLDRYPGELSGGEKQRVAIARAFATQPDLVICDEPVSSLDVSVQGALMNLLLDFQDEGGTSYLFISHDLAAVQHLSHLLGVMYLGKLVEQGEATRVLAAPSHPYTEALLSAVPEPDPEAHLHRVRAQERWLPRDNDDSGCPFHPRCPRLLGDICRTEVPPWQLPGRRLLAGKEDDPEIVATADHAIRCHISYAELTALQTAPEDPAPEAQP